MTQLLNHVSESTSFAKTPLVKNSLQGVCKTFYIFLPSSSLFMLLLLLLPGLIPTHPSIFSSNLTNISSGSLTFYSGRMGNPYFLFPQEPTQTTGTPLHEHFLPYHPALICELPEEQDHGLYIFLSLASST